MQSHATSGSTEPSLSPELEPNWDLEANLRDNHQEANLHDYHQSLVKLFMKVHPILPI